MNTYNIKTSILLILSAFGVKPMLKGQISEKKPTRIIIYTDTNAIFTSAVWEKYTEDLQIWADSLRKIAANNSNKSMPLPPLPESITLDSLGEFEVESENMGDSMVVRFKIEEPVIEIKEIEEIDFEDEISIQIEDNPMKREPEANHPHPPASAKRFNKRHAKAEIIQTNSRFNLGFLQMQNANQYSATVFRDDYMPELNNGKSLQIGFEHSWGLNLIKGKLRFWYGIAYDIQNYRFSNNAARIHSNTTIFKHSYATLNPDAGNNADKSKLVTNYLGIPIAIGFQNKKHNPNFFLKAGIQAGYLVRSHTKFRLGNGTKLKEYDDFALNDFAVHPFVFIQFGNIALFGKYAISQMYEYGASQKNFSFGLSLSTDID
jgi:hypothetical protein